MKDAFSFWKKNGQLDFLQGDVRIYSIGSDDYLFVGQTMYASTTERPWYIKNVLPYVKGSVLEIGLGLGCASKVILANPAVRKLLTIENNPDVVAAFGRPLPRHLILLTDIYGWAEKVPKETPLYDFIFVDHYASIEEEEVEKLRVLAVLLAPLVKNGGRMVFWIDVNAPESDQAALKELWLINGAKNG